MGPIHFDAMVAAKQDVLDQLTSVLGMSRIVMADNSGSSTPSVVYKEAARQVGVSYSSMPQATQAIIEKAGHSWHPTYDSRASGSGGGSTVTVSGNRALLDALHVLLAHADDASADAYLLTWNPSQWHWDPIDIAAAIDATAEGQIVAGRWSTGRRTTEIDDGARAFLLKQGDEPRGIIASGVFRTPVFQDDHWDESGRLANYADIDWDTVVDPTRPLPLSVLKTAVPAQEWEPQASGTRIDAARRPAVEELWANHVEGPERQSGQARIADAAMRKKIEEAAQDRLMHHYIALGWIVEDTHIGNPFDARATKDGDVRYLEAKGTTSDGWTVIVTRNEVNWAREHAGECVMGIWSGIKFTAAGDVDPVSGHFEIVDWLPVHDDLKPISYDWATGSADRLHP